MPSFRSEEEVVKRSSGGKVGVCRGEMKGEGVAGGEVSLDMGESGAAEQRVSWVRLNGREVPSFHTTVSGVLLRLCVLPL